MSTSKDITSFDDMPSRRASANSYSEDPPTSSHSMEIMMKLIRCSVSSMLAFHRGTFQFYTDEEENATETAYFFFINACRCKDKKGVFTDVSSFDQNDGILVNQPVNRLQQGMVDFFTDEIKTYLVGNNEPIACTTSHHLLASKVRERLELFKKLKRAVEELAIEIPNHAEMFTFVVLKKEISMFDQTLTEKSSILKSINEGLINFR